LIEPYSTGTGYLAPVMGNSYGAVRGLWWNGTSASSTTIQDDLSILSNTNNGFGYRADDYGNSTSAATSVVTSGGAFSISGVVEKMSDSDYFSFTSPGGIANFTAAVAQFGPTLDLKLDVRSANGTLISTADTTTLG